MPHYALKCNVDNVEADFVNGTNMVAYAKAHSDANGHDNWSLTVTCGMECNEVTLRLRGVARMLTEVSIS